MKYPGFIGGAYTLSSKTLDSQRCVNLFPVLDEMQTGKDGNAAMLVTVPGKRLLVDLADGGTIRCEYCASNGSGYSVSGKNVYSISVAFGQTLIGTLNSASGPVTMADNGVQMMIVDGFYGYIYTFSTGVFAVITDTDMPRSSHVRFCDGYFALNEIGTGRFFLTALYDGFSIDALDFATAEGSPDNLIAIEVLRRQLWLFGTESTQVYFNSGDVDFPFSPINGVFIEAGCVSAFSVAKIDQTIFWVGKNKDGHGVVYMANGYQPQRVSTNAIEAAINSYGDISDAVAFGYQQQGDTFYQINFDATSWVYSLNSGMWHERCYFNDGQLSRDRVNTHMFFNSTHVVGDYKNAKLYALDLDHHADGDRPRKWLRAAPHIANDLNFIYYHKFQVDMQFGVGTSTGSGALPVMIMRRSNDGGNSWSSERYASMGLIGERTVRANFNKEGRARDRVYEVSGTDPVKVALIGGYLDFTVGSR